MATIGIQARLLVSMAFASVVFSAIVADLPTPPAGLTAPSKPLHIPAFSLSTPAGAAVRANDFRGKVLIARFWATW